MSMMKAMPTEVARPATTLTTTMMTTTTTTTAVVTPPKTVPLEALELTTVPLDVAAWRRCFR
jgi:hypothetical protein